MELGSKVKIDFLEWVGGFSLSGEGWVWEGIWPGLQNFEVETN